MSEISQITSSIRLGVNIDHIATLRNARGENDPSLLELAFAAQSGGADSLTMHLREDRRHIKDEDVFEVKKHCKIPVNFEMAATEEMTDIALELKPRSVCIVPENREEITTEGGLDVIQHFDRLKPLVKKMIDAEIEVFMFIEPDSEQIKQSAELGVSGVEVHTGSYAHAFLNAFELEKQKDRLLKAAIIAMDQRLEFHAGHGLNYHNMAAIVALPALVEVNIGHAIVSRALVTGLARAVKQMKQLLV